MKRVFCVFGVALLLTGCAPRASQIDFDAKGKEFNKRMAQVYNWTPAKPLTKAEVAAWTFLRNRDIKLKFIELEGESARAVLASTDALPGIIANYQHTYRSKLSLSTSKRLGEVDLGEVDSVPSYSSEKDNDSASIGIHFDVINMLKNYMLAEKAGNEREISRLNLERAAEQSIREAFAAYYMKVAEQTTKSELESVGSALSGKIDELCQSAPENSPSTDKLYSVCSDGLTKVRVIQSVKQHFESSAANLNALLSVHPTTRVDVVLPDFSDPGELKMPVDDLVKMAVALRPELFIEEYHKESAKIEKKTALLDILPSVEVGYEQKYDSNTFLVNNSWGQAYVRLNADLLKQIIQAPMKRQIGEIKYRMADSRQESLLIAVATQVNLAYTRYNAARSKWLLSHKLAYVKRLQSERAHGKVAVGLTEPIEQTLTGLEHVGAQYQEIADYADMMDAAAQMYLALGIQVLPLTEGAQSAEQIAQRFSEKLSSLGIM
mgnify:FL=1